MPTDTLIHQTGAAAGSSARRPEPCVMVLFGASGDLTRRLLMPALYNLACERFLPDRFAVVGVARDNLTTDQFRARLSADIRTFSTRRTFDEAAWDALAGRLHYLPGPFDDDATYARLSDLLGQFDADLGTLGNRLFYLAIPPALFRVVAGQLAAAGLNRPGPGWRRLVVEKPFGHDLTSATELNRALLVHWTEDQVYRIDHYLGKETVQNLLAFRFANGLFEPVWNNDHVDHVQLSVAETVGVEGRGEYYDRSGVLRDVIQNHIFQMLAHVCMDRPASFEANAVRDAKVKLLDAVRVFEPDEVPRHVVRGQYGPGTRPDGTAVFGYRQEKSVPPASGTPTFAALRLFIDNDRWRGVPIYLRSGKSLWKRGTEIIVEFKQPADDLFRDTAADGQLDANRLIFHIQPDQGVEIRFQAKAPGPAMALQKVNMRFDYRDLFEASRWTGYEVLLYRCMTGDATLFSRTDLVETAWRIAQPILDAWAADPPADFPNYAAGSWGTKAAFDLIARDGRRWVEVINRGVLEKVPLFQGADPTLLNNLAMMLRPVVFGAGEEIIRQGAAGSEMYFISRGQAEAVDSTGRVLNTLGDGGFFGEIALLLDRPRTATVRAVTACDLFVLDRDDFQKVMKDYPQLAGALRDNARQRYQITDPG
jgi:glucose-6-phosphate 1-dehydrogenase